MIVQAYDCLDAVPTDLPVAFAKHSTAPKAVLDARKPFRTLQRAIRPDKSRTSTLWTLFIHPLTAEQFARVQAREGVVLHQFETSTTSLASDRTVGCFGFKTQNARDSFIRQNHDTVWCNTARLWVGRNYLL